MGNIAKKAKKKGIKSADVQDIHRPGRPTKYTIDMPEMLRHYIAKCPDEADLPSKAGFARFIHVSEETIDRWGVAYPPFCVALGELKAAQHTDLMNRGLLSTYNPTICKLLLMSVHDHVERRDNTSKGESITPQLVNFADAVKQENDDSKH